MILKQIKLSHEEVARIARGRPEVSLFQTDAQASALLVSYAMLRELGGVNDRLASRVVDASIGKTVPPATLNGELVSGACGPGFKVTSTIAKRLEVRVPGFSAFVRNCEDGVAIFPALAARELARQGLEAVIVKSWLLTTTFSKEDPKTRLFKDEMRELIENDAYLYSELIARKRVVLQGSHDLVDHAAAARADGWIAAAGVASKVAQKLSVYFAGARKGNIASHLIPFALGVLLDELAQSAHYGSGPRILAIEALLAALENSDIRPDDAVALRDFPTSIDEVTAAARSGNGDLSAVRASVTRYASEIRSLAYRIDGRGAR